MLKGGASYLSRETVRWLKVWREHGKINGGPIFRRLIGREHIGDVFTSRQHRTDFQTRGAELEGPRRAARLLAGIEQEGRGP